MFTKHVVTNVATETEATYDVIDISLNPTDVLQMAVRLYQRKGRGRHETRCY